MTKPVPGAKRGRPRPDKMPLKKISLEADPIVLTKFDRWAKKHGLTRSAAFRRVLRDLDYSAW